MERHLVFRIKDQLFTVHVDHVKSIIKLPRLFTVPQAPEYILGVINVDGDVTPVVDAAKKMMMGVTEIFEQSQVIIMQFRPDEADKENYIGFLVDEVNEVSDVDPHKMQALPTSKHLFDERQVSGMHKIENEFCMQINIETFFKGDIESLFETSKK